MSVSDKCRDAMKTTQDQIAEAVKKFDWVLTGRLAGNYADQLRATSTLKPGVLTVLKLLLKNRQYDAVMGVADAALAVAPDNRQVWRDYAQALVDQGRTAPALRIYAGMADDPAVPAGDRAEARGGVGRCYKELFLTATDPDRRVDYLRRALEAYGGLYHADRRLYWHGINAVALLARAQRESLFVPGIPDPGQIANSVAAQVLNSVENLQGPWEKATACEAHVARGELENAVRRARDLVKDKQTDAFILNSLCRQLLKVWQLDRESDLGTTLLPVLRSALVQKSGGEVTLSAADVATTRLDKLEEQDHGDSEAAGVLEKVFGTDRFQTLQWWRNGLLRCRAVVRIDDLNGAGRGTGFLVKGKDLHSSLPDLVVVTNGHVVPEAISADDAVVAFHGLDSSDRESNRFGVRRLWWYSPSSHPNLDTTLLELDGMPDNVEPVPLVSKMPTLNANSRTYIIGHPKGYDQPQFSIQDNLLLDYDDTRLHYRSPTEGGSSGSPVFESQWQVIGLHHAGSVTMTQLRGNGTYAANEALRIDAIRAAIAEDPQSPKD
ncbi:MAG TPA: trypsin-like peptidase domain-containing protein [Mycobacterium sp.]|nr:trypsin-like peptidase domain-containing protein [Mycobacterium sp.]